MGFRYKRGVKVEYVHQGLIYFYSRSYQTLKESDRHRILNLCHQYGGEYYQALFEFVTSDITATDICIRHFLGKSTLYRAVKKYYEGFSFEV